MDSLSASQYWLILSLLLGLMIWCVVVLANGFRRWRLQAGLVPTLPADRLPRTERALQHIDELANQPALLTAQLNYLRLLPLSELRDVVLLGLMSTGYLVDLSQDSSLYYPDGIGNQDGGGVNNELFVAMEDSEVASPSKGRLRRTAQELTKSLIPPILSGCLTTPVGIPVLLGLQSDSRPYSRAGLSALVRACEQSACRGLLVYMGTDLPRASISPLVVLISGHELLDILADFMNRHSATA